MRTNTVCLALCGLATISAAVPVERRSVDNNVIDEFQNIDSFPAPQAQELLSIEQRAHGTLSNGTPPPSANPDTFISLQVIAAEEQFEAAFFQQLLSNVTYSVPGYGFKSVEEWHVAVKALTAIVAQEELHALNAINALKHFNQTPIEPCLYNFPVSTFDEAINLAKTFTGVVLATLQNVILNMAEHGDAPLTQGIASVIGQEGEQEGWFRSVGGEIPSELPFLTNSVRDFAFNTLNQTFFVPGSCPNLAQIQSLQELHTMEPLTITKTFDPSNSTDETVGLSFWLPEGAKATDYEVAYINQQNIPFVLPFNVTSQQGQTVWVQAPFPFKEHELNGLTILAVVPTSAAATLTSNQAVANATLAGPGLVIVN